MFAKQQGLPFFIENDNWQYTYEKGWHDYFSSLNDFKDAGKYTEVKRYRHPDPMDLPQFSLREYVAAIKNIFVLTSELQKKVDDYADSIGGEFTSLYIRRGDKVIEMPLIAIDDILAQTDIKDDGRNIYLQTDDYTCVEIIKDKFPSCNIMTLTPVHKRGADNQKMRDWRPEERKVEMEELLIATAVFVRCKKGWSYYLSNVGTFHKLFGYDVIELYTDLKYSREHVKKVYSLDTVGNPYELTI